MEFNKNQDSLEIPISGAIPSKSFEPVLEQSYMTTAIYCVTVRDNTSKQSVVIQVAAISPESAKNRILEVAPNRLKYISPEIINIVRAY